MSRWRNENNGCSGDELDFMRMRGRWDKDEGGFLFSKQDTPDGFFLIVGTEKKMLSEHYSAMLVSDPIQCQQGDGIVTLRHWTTPSVHIRICIRQPSRGKQYDWCSEKVTRNGTKPAQVTIPGSILYTFEIVIEAYNFVFDTFGKEGGMAVLDDISYNSSAIYKCAMIPHVDTPPTIDENTCRNIRCNFEDENCVQKLKGTGWKTSSKAEGSFSAGIRDKLEGHYAYVRGPGTFSFQLGQISLNTHVGLEFCYYVTSYKAALKIYLKPADKEKDLIFDSTENAIGHQWQCEKYIMMKGNYDYVRTYS
ncbi:unnamed protein product [Auanema sp. JU1783]|nr:unnamed protein product [Auanema sp. JU1783]